LLKRLDAIEKSVTSAEQRVNFFEETQRPLRNDIVAFRQSFAEVGRNLEELQARNERNLEAGKRLEQTLHRIDGDLTMLARQDENFTERLQLHVEHMRRLEERIAGLLDDQTTHDEIFQKMDVVRNEGQYLAERMASVEKTLDDQRATIEEQSHALDLIGPRLQGHADRLTEVHHSLASYHEDLLTHLQRWSQLYEKQRRRQISQLEQELRELKQYEFKLKPE
jgi:chromosome segregation ATPase